MKGMITIGCCVIAIVLPSYSMGADKPDFISPNAALSSTPTKPNLERRVITLEKEVDWMKKLAQWGDIPLDKPNLSPQEVALLSDQYAKAIYSYNYREYAFSLRKLSMYFTEGGYRSFLRALEESRNLEAVIAQNLSVQAEARGEPVVQSEAANEGMYRWVVKVPLAVTYSSESGNTPQKPTVQKVSLTLELIRVPFSVNRMGVAINRVVATLDKDTPAGALLQENTQQNVPQDPAVTGQGTTQGTSFNNIPVSNNIPASP